MMRRGRAARVLATMLVLALFTTACSTSQNPLEAQIGPREPADARLLGTWALAGGGTTFATIENFDEEGVRSDELKVTLRDHEKSETEEYRLRFARFSGHSYASATRLGKPVAWKFLRWRFLGEDTIVIDAVDDAFLWRAARGGAIRGITRPGPPEHVALTATSRELREFVRFNDAMFGGQRFELSRMP
jgi:hypothetical protein